MRAPIGSSAPPVRWQSAVRAARYPSLEMHNEVDRFSDQPVRHGDNGLLDQLLEAEQAYARRITMDRGNAARLLCCRTSSSAGRHVGKECVSQWTSMWSPDHYNNNKSRS